MALSSISQPSNQSIELFLAIKQRMEYAWKEKLFWIFAVGNVPLPHNWIQKKTHQTIEHFVQYRAETPPVHHSGIGLLP